MFAVLRYAKASERMPGVLFPVWCAKLGSSLPIALQVLPFFFGAKKLFTLLALGVSSLRRGHANLLCIVPILTDDPRRESKTTADTILQTTPGGMGRQSERCQVEAGNLDQRDALRRYTDDYLLKMRALRLAVFGVLSLCDRPRLRSVGVGVTKAFQKLFALMF